MLSAFFPFKKLIIHHTWIILSPFLWKHFFCQFMREVSSIKISKHFMVFNIKCKLKRSRKYNSITSHGLFLPERNKDSWWVIFCEKS